MAELLAAEPFRPDELFVLREAALANVLTEEQKQEIVRRSDHAVPDIPQPEPEPEPEPATPCPERDLLPDA